MRVSLNIIIHCSAICGYVGLQSEMHNNFTPARTLMYSNIEAQRILAAVGVVLSRLGAVSQQKE